MKGVVKQTLNKNYLFTNQSELSIFMIVVVANKPCMCDWTTRLNLNTSLMDVMVASQDTELVTNVQLELHQFTGTWNSHHKHMGGSSELCTTLDKLGREGLAG